MPPRGNQTEGKWERGNAEREEAIDLVYLSESHPFVYEWESRAAKHVVIQDPRRYPRAVKAVSRISTSRQISCTGIRHSNNHP